ELTIVRPDAYSHIPTSKTFLDAGEYSRSRQTSRLPGACLFWISFEISQICFSDSSDFHGHLMIFFSWPFIPSLPSQTMDLSGVLIRCISQNINLISSTLIAVLIKVYRTVVDLKVIGA